ncbi:MAG: 2-succinyl-6-hydroxy-2,4-cyclohexadiene-1-carboxylate synthase [Anaerolineae bacterium]|nr:2-succinyl-6-hydroxy-2,4-cyclohexadiene-1-carboxylate synthase [Anaerolineae bacterium]
MLRHLQVNQLNYRVGQFGNTGALPWMFLHGFTGRIEHWQGQIERLQASYPLIIPDLIGHGETDSPLDSKRYQIESAAADLIAMLDQLAIEKIGLLGYSMGGRLALYTALHYPNRIDKLILESASPGLATIEERSDRIIQDEQLAIKIEREGMMTFVEYWENLPLFASQTRLSDEVKQRLRALRLQNRPQGLAGSLRGMGTGSQPSLWDFLPQLTCPTLLITGDLDHKFTQIAEKMSRRLPDVQHIQVQAAGHTVHLEQPELFTEIVLAFIER